MNLRNEVLCWLGLALVLSGCFGYVHDRGDGGGAVVVAQPEVSLFGGYDDGGQARDYGRRGAESRQGGGDRDGDRNRDGERR
jgi:hypothetical protein